MTGATTASSCAVANSPLGPLTLIAAGGALTRLYLDEQRHLWATASVRAGDRAVLDDAADQLAAYFAGGRTDFELPLQAAGTPFQLAVWSALRAIPYGTTVSYGQLARELGRPGAARAVGMACGRNPIGILVPCHRVVGSTGRLTGYAGGLTSKQQLLALERGEPGTLF